MKMTFDDKEYNFWDIVIKAISAVLTIGTLIIGVITFLNNQDEEIRQKDLEYRKEISTTQRLYYSQMSDIIGALEIFSEEGNFNADFAKKRDEFKTLYFGRMNMVESKEVDMALSNFNSALERRIEANTTFDDAKFKTVCFNVNTAFRNSLRKSGDIHLDTLTKH